MSGNVAEDVSVTCSVNIDNRLCRYLYLIPAVLIIFGFSWLEKRRRLRQDRFSGRPGLVVPMSFVDDYRQRWWPALAFGACSNEIVRLFTSDHDVGFNLPSWAQVLVVLLSALVISVVFYPVVLCGTSRYRLLGSSLGLLYTLSWLTVRLLETAGCVTTVGSQTVAAVQRSRDAGPAKPPETSHYVELLTSLPEFVCCLGLAGRHVYVLFGIFIRGQPWVDLPDLDLADQHHRDHVTALLKSPPPQMPELPSRPPLAQTRVLAQWLFLRAKLYVDYRRSFRYPGKLIAVVVVILCVFIRFFASYAYSEGSLLTLVSRLMPLSEKGRFVMRMLSVVWKCTVPMTMCIVIANLILLLKSYKLHLLALFRGDHGLKYSCDKFARNLVAASVFFPGYQIAYAMSGALVSHFLMFVTIFLTLCVLASPYILGSWELLKAVGLFLLAYVLSSLVLRKSQRLAVWLFFLLPALEAGQRKPFSVDNRRGFMNFSYFAFLLNVTTGLYAAAKRLIYALALNCLFMGRLDRSVYPRDFEFRDRGHKAYVGMLYMEHNLNNPVLRVFCDVIMKSVTEKKTERRFYGDRARPWVRRRWQVAYTLVRNPGLCEQRAPRHCDVTCVQVEADKAGSDMEDVALTL